MLRNFEFRWVFMHFYLSLVSIDTRINAITWPQCGEFVNAKDVINLSAEGKPFHWKLPNLIDSLDDGNATDVEYTLFESPRRFMVPFASQRNSLAKQTLSPALDIVSKWLAESRMMDIPHELTTWLHRIGNDTSTNSSGIPVFLMHGLLETASSWIALGPEHSLAYRLYQSGYDVWMGNSRGTVPSRGHLHLNASGPQPQRKKYWSFTLHEMAIYDLPAFIDYILESTNQTQLHYVGYSQGSTLSFILTSMLPEYNGKIASMIAMAPAVRMTNSRHTFLNILSTHYALIKKVLQHYEIYSLDYGNRALRWLAEFACKTIGTESPFPCRFLLFFLDSNQINCTSLPRIVHSIPNSASVLQLFHFAQMKISGKFQAFRYEDNATNHQIYGETIPEYNFTHTSVPVTIMYSSSDKVSNATDVLFLHAQLRNVTDLYEVPINNFKHIDFIYSRFVRQFVNEKVIDAIKLANQYSSVEPQRTESEMANRTRWSENS